MMVRWKGGMMKGCMIKKIKSNKINAIGQHLVRKVLPLSVWDTKRDREKYTAQNEEKYKKKALSKAKWLVNSK